MEPAGPLLPQGLAFAVAGLTGVALGLVLDAHRAVRRAFRPPRPVGHVLDVLAVALALPVLAGGLLAADWGALRVFVLAGIVLGAAAYRRLASPLVLPAGTWVLRRTGGALAALVRAAAPPARGMWGGARRLGRWLRSRRPPRGDAPGVSGDGGGGPPGSPANAPTGLASGGGGAGAGRTQGRRSVGRRGMAGGRGVRRAGHGHRTAAGGPAGGGRRPV